MAATVSSKLGAVEIDDWIRRERNGYGDAKDLPEYRRLRGELKVRNPYHGLQPLYGLEATLLDLATRADVGQRIQRGRAHRSGRRHNSFPTATAVHFVANERHGGKLRLTFAY
jgi:AbiTii